MDKFFKYGLILALGFGLSACGGGNDDRVEDNRPSSQVCVEDDPNTVDEDDLPSLEEKVLSCMTDSGGAITESMLVGKTFRYTTSNNFFEPFEAELDFVSETQATLTNDDFSRTYDWSLDEDGVLTLVGDTGVTIETLTYYMVSRGDNQAVLVMHWSEEQYVVFENPVAVSVAGDMQNELGCTADLGGLAGDWTPHCEITNLVRDDNGIWSGTFLIPAGTWEYKIALNDSWAESYGYNLSSNNAVFTLTESTEVDFYFDEETRLVTDSTGSTASTGTFYPVHVVELVDVTPN